jgi:hypothetical protein
MVRKICKDGEKTFPKKGKERKYRCKSCGAMAVKEKHLCKPKKI